MAGTTFTDNQTIIYASWLNAVNDAVYNGNFVATTCTFDTIVVQNATITNLTADLGQINLTGNFSILQSGTKIYFQYNGTNIASIDQTGNFVALTTNSGATP